MLNEIFDGESMEYANSGSAISSGDVVSLGDRIGIAVVDIANGDSGTVNLCGVYELDSDTGTAYSQGDMLYWDGTKLTKTAAGNTPAGIAHQAKSSGGTSALVRLQAMPKRAANVAAIATADGSDAATTQALANATKSAVNSILTALKNAGLMKNS